MHPRIDTFVMGTSMAIELMAVLIVGYGAALAFCRVVARLILRRGASSQYDQIRIGLAKAIVLGLEFEIGADLLKTAVAPTWNSIGIVAAIVALRTLLNYSLQKDISQAEAEMAHESAEPA